MRKHLIALVVALIAILLGACGFADTNINHYLESGKPIDDYATDVMPDLESLPHYNSIDYQFYDKYSILGAPRSMLLVVAYDQQTYEDEKRKIDDKYTFLDHAVEAEAWPETFLMPEYDFTIEDYHFRVVAGNEEDYTEYPKRFGMVATSDEKKEIAYLYFSDYDLDFISSPNVDQTMTDFVKEYFRYNWLK